MRINAIPIGKNPPDDINVIIEVPIGGEPIKYEIDKESGALVVDRFLYTPMRYPGNYGFVPHTLSGDGDPIDVLVVNTRALVPGAVINVPPDRRADDGRRGRRRREDRRRAGRQADAPLREGPELYRPARDHDRADRAFLHALQGSRARQMGEGRRAGATPPKPRAIIVEAIERAKK